MAQVPKYLYTILHPNYALVASMLPPEAFGKHYGLGSSRYFHGQVLFAEVDNTYRHEYFEIDRYLDEMDYKPDGTPKRTKFIKTYRVLEHLDLSAFKNLYITSVLGNVLELARHDEYKREHEPGYVRIYQEVCPLSSVVLSYMTPQDFGAYITDPDQPKGAPKVLFTQIDLNIDRFLVKLQENPFLDSPIPNVHPHKLRDQILEIRGNPEKRVKGISLDSAFGRLPFTSLRTGFWIAEGRDVVFYPIPDTATLERDHYDWYRSLTQ